MAQEPEAGRNASGVARTGKRKWGYDPAQVDAFLERAHMLYESEGVQLTQHDIQNVSFDLVKGGYVIAQVDAALARLERAVVDKQTTWEISQHGRVAWKAQTEALYRQLDEHAKRAAGERFKSGEPKTPSYDRKQVDRIIDQSMAKAASELDIEKISREDAKHLVDLNSTSVANVIFTQRKGKRGYDERQVENTFGKVGSIGIFCQIAVFTVVDDVALSAVVECHCQTSGSLPFNKRGRKGFEVRRRKHDVAPTVKFGYALERHRTYPFVGQFQLCEQFRIADVAKQEQLEAFRLFGMLCGNMVDGFSHQFKAFYRVVEACRAHDNHFFPDGNVCRAVVGKTFHRQCVRDDGQRLSCCQRTFAETVGKPAADGHEVEVGTAVEPLFLLPCPER